MQIHKYTTNYTRCCKCNKFAKNKYTQNLQNAGPRFRLDIRNIQSSKLHGQAKGTVFDETYEKVGEQTKVTIEVDFVLSGGLKILGMFAKSKIESSMKTVLDEFANYAKDHSK